MIKFQQYYVTNGETKAKVSYHASTNIHGKACVNIYASDYTRVLGKIFAAEYKNDTDSQSDYFDQGHVTLFTDHPLYAAALERAQENERKAQARYAKRRAKYQAA